MMTKTRSIQKCDYCGGRGTTKDMLNICPECDGCGYNHVERKDEENNTAGIMKDSCCLERG